MTTTPNDPSPAATSADPRWRFIGDVIVLQVKLILGNVQNFLLVPVSIGAALLDLFFHRGEHGGRFYKVMRIGRYVDEAIDVYGAIGGYHGGRDPVETDLSGANAASPSPSSPVDTVIRRVEDAIVREYRKGGTAASVKAAVDRALDQFNSENPDPPKPPSA